MTNRDVPAHYANKGDLTTGPVKAHLIRLTIPMVWAMFAAISFQLVDTYFVSRLGTRALTAMSFTFPVSFVVFNITLGMSIATSSVIARQLGQGKPARVRRIVRHALLMAFALGILLATGGVLLIKPIFRAMGAPPDVLPLTLQFMRIWFIGSLFINTPLVANAAIRATGDTMFPAKVMTFAVLINIILDPPLIFGYFGLPALGIQGAAIATVAANACATAAGLYFLSRRKKLLRWGRTPWKLFGDSARRLLSIALPVGLTSAILPLTSAIITAFLASTGAKAVAAYGIATRVESFAFIVIIALATGMAPLIGQNWGAGKFSRVNETLRRAFYFAAAWSLGVAVLIELLARPLARIFSNDPAVIDQTILYFRIIPPTYVLGNLVPGWGSAFNAMGLPKRSFLMIVIRLLAVNLPVAWLGGKFFGAVGIFSAIAVTNIVTGGLFHLINRRFCQKLERQENARAPTLDI